MNDISDRSDLRQMRREALFVLLLWCAAGAYTLGYSWWFGYRQDSGDLPMVWGIPSWVFWGVFAPWLACTVIGIWFSIYFMTDEDVSEDETDPAVTNGKELNHG